MTVVTEIQETKFICTKANSDIEGMKKAINLALDIDYRRKLRSMINSYENGRTSGKVVQLIAKFFVVWEHKVSKKI